MKKASILSFQSIDSNIKILNSIQNGISEGKDFFELVKLINTINDDRKVIIISEVIEAMKNSFGYPPSRYCWLEMGSAGRGEQISRTDQDNALIYEGSHEDEKNKEIGIYFQELSQRVNTEFQKSSFSLCPGNVMACNEFWRGTKEFWYKRVKEWVEVPKAENIRNLTIFLDFKPLCGSVGLGHALRKKLNDHIRLRPLFMTFLAKDACSGIASSGKGKINIKTHLLVRIVDCVRIFAIKYGCGETSTISRIAFLEEKGVFSSGFATGLIDSLEFILTLKLYAEDNMIESSALDSSRKEDLDYAIDNILTLFRITKEEFFPDS